MTDTNRRNYNTGNYNTGNRNTGNWNTGYWNTGNYNTGDYNPGDWNTGNCNTGNYNTGNYNTGNRNTGSRNIGYYNTGSWNIGYRNTGYWNTGNYNTGNYNTGYCNTITPENCLIFNKPAKRQDWLDATIPKWMQVTLTDWVEEKEMSEKEKEAYPTYITTGGYLKVYQSLKHAYVEAWENTTQKDRDLTAKLPNFPLELEADGTDIFKEVFGFANPFIQNKKETIKIGEDTYEITDEFLNELKKLKKVDKTKKA